VLMRLRAATRAASVFGSRAQLHHAYSRSCYSPERCQATGLPGSVCESCRSAFNVCMHVSSTRRNLVVEAGIPRSQRTCKLKRGSRNAPPWAITMAPAASDSSPNGGVRCWQKHESEINMALRRPRFRRQLFLEREIYKVPVES
jgi:hypothetical protein